MHQTQDNSASERMLDQLYQARKIREELETSNQRQQAMIDELGALKHDELLEVLIADTDYSFTQFNLNDSDFSRRAVIRSVFSFIEGEIFALKQEILAQTKHSRFTALTPEEILSFREKSPQADNSGKIKSVTKFIDLRSSIRMTFRYYPTIFEFHYELEVSGLARSSFLNAIKVRHRITHPKNGADMSISNQEFAETYVAFRWFKDSIGEMLNLRVHATKSQQPGISRF